MSGNYRFERIKARYDLDMGSFWPRDKFGSWQKTLQELSSWLIPYADKLAAP